MRHLGTLLLAISLSLGALSAATAYLARLDSRDERLIGVKLAAPVMKVTEEGERITIAEAEEEVTADLLKDLRAVRIDDKPLRYIQVREFSFARWPGRWLFLLALVGLTGTGLWIKSMVRKSAVAPVKREEGSPNVAFAQIRRIVDSLRNDLPGMADDRARLREIVHRLDEVQKHHAVTFVDARAELRARLGVTGYALLMDRFAGAERLINRAWSAAADGVLEEALDSLEIAAERLVEAQEYLPEADLTSNEPSSEADKGAAL